MGTVVTRGSSNTRSEAVRAHPNEHLRFVLGSADAAEVALRSTLVAVATRPDQPKLLAIGAEHADCPGFPIPIADRAGPENRLALLSFLGQKSDMPIVVLQPSHMAIVVLVLHCSCSFRSSLV